MGKRTESTNGSYRSNSSITAQEFIENYMEVYRAGGTNKDLANRLGVKLQQVYPLRDRTNKLLETENTQLPPLIPVDRKYGSGLNTQELAELVRKELGTVLNFTAMCLVLISTESTAEEYVEITSDFMSHGFLANDLV